MPSSAAAGGESEQKQGQQHAFHLVRNFSEFDVNFLDRQSHDVVERTVDALDGGVADPLLNAVGTGLVVGDGSCLA